MRHAVDVMCNRLVTFYAANEGEDLMKHSFTICVLTVVAACLLTVPTVRAQTAVEGQWSGVLNWPVEAIHTVMLPTGKVLVWQTWRESVGL